MTNLEKLKGMDELEFAAAIAAVTVAFKKTAKDFEKYVPDVIWGTMFAEWLKGFVSSKYDGAFDDSDDGVKEELDDMLKKMMRGDRRGNPFEGV